MVKNNKNLDIMNKELKRINQEFIQNINSYQNFIKQSQLDAPIEVLCLPNPIIKILLRNGCVRVFHILDLDLTKIKGLGSIKISLIKIRLNEFFPGIL